MFFFINTNSQIISEGFIDSLFSDFQTEDSPNIGFFVLKDGQVAAMQSYGYSDYINKVKANNNNLYHLSNLTKQFTSAAIFMLKEEGKINFEDRIGDILSDFPAYTHKITILDLLNHTSGLPDYKDKYNYEDYIKLSEREIIDFIKSQDSLIFKPGTKFFLNSTDYFLLAYIIEKISGKPYSKFISKNIFKPLGMNNTFVYNNYKPKKNKYINYYSFRNTDSLVFGTNKGFKYAIGNEGIFTSIQDYLKWETALVNNQILSKESTDLIFSRATLQYGSEPNVKFGYGWMNDINYWMHVYYIFGADLYCTNLVLKIPNDKIAIVILGNRNSIFGLRKKAFTLARKVSKFPYVIK
ncbi:MAG: serine hydrolase [Bacteroidales bacterium]|nr:serine hydrolase [Bacteroidales bacterium]